MVVAVNAVEKANAEKIKNDEIDTSETEIIGQTGPQAMKAVVRYFGFLAMFTYQLDNTTGTPLL